MPSPHVDSCGRIDLERRVTKQALTLGGGDHQSIVRACSLSFDRINAAVKSVLDEVLQATLRKAP